MINGNNHNKGIRPAPLSRKETVLYLHPDSLNNSENLSHVYKMTQISKLITLLLSFTEVVLFWWGH